MRCGRVLQSFNSQFHEPGYQQGKGICEQQKYCSAGIAPAELRHIGNKSGKVFDGWVQHGGSGRVRLALH